MCVRLKNDKVRHYIVSYINSWSVYKAAVDLLPEAPFLGSMDGRGRSESYQLSSHLNHIHTFLSKRGDNSVLLVEAAEL